MQNILKGHVLRRGVQIRCHDFRNLAILLRREIGRRPARTQKYFELSASLSLRPDFAPTNKIAFRNNAHQLAGFANGKATNVTAQHQVRSFKDERLGPDDGDPARHNLMCAHYQALP